MTDRHAIITLPHPDLRQVSVKVHVITSDISQLVEDMTSATLDWEDSRPHELGVALAAVQIDRLERVVIVRDDFDDKNNRKFTALINPEIVKYEGEIIYDHEGCLSVKDVYGLVPRYSKVRVKATGLDGREIRLKLDGFLARILQHEIDHTKGKLFVDYIENDKKAFFTLDKKGKLEPLAYEDVKKANILRD